VVGVSCWNGRGSAMEMERELAAAGAMLSSSRASGGRRRGGSSRREQVSGNRDQTADRVQDDITQAVVASRAWIGHAHARMTPVQG
jgi:hypothetical protein